MKPMFGRRELLRRTAGGLGSIALAAMLAEEGSAATHAAANDPLAAKVPHFPAKAKRVILLYMTGGVSHVDSFDPKPELYAGHGKKITVDNWQGKIGEFPRFLKRPDWQFRPGGESGTEVSDLFPKTREIVDELCVIRSMSTDHTNHYESTLGMHCGSWTFARPSLGAWISYGLGTVNRNLPSFVVVAPQAPYAGAQTWGSDFLPGSHKGTQFIPGDTPIPNIQPRVGSAELQKMELELLAQANRRHAEERPDEAVLDARIRSFETAFGMQQEAPEALDLSTESAATLQAYGLQPGQKSGFGWQCLVARRLAERGVRFIELIDVGSSNNWDAHGDMQTHLPLAKNVDGPIAALITDLKQRGMLDDTLVVWTTEFGRTPYHETANHAGREHHHQVFSSWLAGGGVKGGIVHGASDDLGIAVDSDRVHVHDFHATILHLLGLDHEQLTFRHAGRDYRLTDVHGNVVREILS
ncbi:DUF1501 domain-containing protein [Rosistilla oblonga]|uniref:Sulfatase n=1 Tax=Rosistilla oblonga TaxID=2527990 RepID=A0A518J182_9BACT|nr:DUF1501 domain-containing protein [Rosistilla oblonga]QDV59100.1 hypothetical protein Mal33_51250 [Rosistilla oblonga]